MFINKDNKLNTLKKWIENSNYTVIFTGAGMSTESGIPDFRSKDGLWKGIDPMRVACVDALITNYNLFYEFYKQRIENLEKSNPHKGYDILSNWERKGLISSVITQNVDGFHQRAGNKRVYPLHGSINTFRCSRCGQSASKDNFINKDSCIKCGGTLRPDVVLFGEALPQDILNNAIKEIQKSELVIVIGTSLMVYPVNSLPSMSKGKKVYINKEIYKQSFDLDLEGKAGEILEAVNQQLN